MNAEIPLAKLAALLAAPARAAMVEALSAEGAKTAIELAAIADVQPQTASSHLAKLMDGGIVASDKHGRHRFYRIAGGHVSDVVEALNELLPAAAPTGSRPPNDLAIARTCYDHLAGRLGTTLADAMAARRYIRPDGMDFVLARAGENFLRGLGVDIDTARSQRRLFARRCLDWTERRYHLGGALGAALARRCFDAGWIRRGEDDRTVTVTAKGNRAFRADFGLSSKL